MRIRNEKLYNAFFNIWFFLKYQFLNYAIVILSVCLCSYIFDKWVEGIAFCVAHCLIRYKMNYVYHSTNFCIHITLLIIWFCIPTVAYVKTSLLSSIPIAFLICLIGNIAQERNIFRVKNEELVLENAQILQSFKPKPFNVDNCTKDELLARCRQLGFSASQTDLAVEFFIDKTKQSVLADKFCVEETSISKQKYRLKKKLNIPQ